MSSIFKETERNFTEIRLAREQGFLAFQKKKLLMTIESIPMYMGDRRPSMTQTIFRLERWISFVSLNSKSLISFLSLNSTSLISALYDLFIEAFFS